MSAVSPSNQKRIASGRYAPVWLYGLMLTCILLFTYFAPHADGDVAVLVSPFSGRADAALTVVHADGRIVDVARWPFIVLAHSGQGQSGPEFITRLYGAGALLVFSPGITSGCFKRD